MPHKKTFESKLKDWHEEFVWFICAEDHFHCEVCKRAKVGGLWSNCRKVSEKLQKSLLTDHSKENRHLSALEICKEQDKNKIFWSSKEEKALKEREKKSKECENNLRAMFFLSREEFSINTYPAMIEFCKKRGMENISASSHASIKSAWSFVDAVDVVVLQEDSELIRSAYMHGLILDPVNFGAVEWLVICARCVTSQGKIVTVFWDAACVPDGSAISARKVCRNAYPNS